jgi:hypothetical protein
MSTRLQDYAPVVTEQAPVSRRMSSDRGVAHGVRTAVQILVMTLGYSRRGYADDPEGLG